MNLNVYIYTYSDRIYIYIFHFMEKKSKYFLTIYFFLIDIRIILNLIIHNVHTYSYKKIFKENLTKKNF